MDKLRSWCIGLGCLGYIIALPLLWFAALSTGNGIIIVLATIYLGFFWLGGMQAMVQFTDVLPTVATIFIFLLTGYVFFAHIMNFGSGGPPFKVFLTAILLVSAFFTGEWLNGRGVVTLLKNDRNDFFLNTIVSLALFSGIEVGLLTQSWWWGVGFFAMVGVVLLFITGAMMTQDSTDHNTTQAA